MSKFLLVETVVVKCLVDGQTDAPETVDFHDVVAEVVENVILRQVGHHLVQQHNILEIDVAPRDVIVVQRHLLVGTCPAPLQKHRFRHVVVGKHVVVDHGLQRRRPAGILRTLRNC